MTDASSQTNDLQAVAQALLTHTGPIVVLSHENPDGDALGSVLGLTRALRQLGREVIAPMHVPRFLAFVPRPGELSDRLSSWPEGAMAAVLKLPLEEIQKALEGLEGVEIANLNAPEQTVISGRRQAVEEAAERLKERRARVVFLPVSAPFHSSLMAPARKRLAEDLAQVPLRRPRFPVYSNVTARPEEDPERIRALLLEQITAPVRWVEILRDMEARGVKRFLEFGSGEVLKGLVLRTLKEAEALSVQDPDSLRKALEVERA